jgi:hypothetical protein
MSCGDMSSVGSANQDAAQHAVASVSDGASDRGFDCGCGSCHAASPQTWTVVLSPAERPSVAASVVIEPVNPTRAPVAPPPQARA